MDDLESGRISPSFARKITSRALKALSRKLSLYAELKQDLTRRVVFHLFSNVHFKSPPAVFHSDQWHHSHNSSDLSAFEWFGFGK